MRRPLRSQAGGVAAQSATMQSSQPPPRPPFEAPLETRAGSALQPRVTKLSSKAVLNAHSEKLFASESLKDRIARALCDARCLPRKEFFEGWEVARRIRRRMRGGHVFDLAAGHGVVAAMLLLLDGSSPGATCVDTRRPKSNQRVMDALAARWPRLQDEVNYVEGRLETVRPGPDDIVVSVHACGALTDRVLDVAIAARCRVAVLPCCHSIKHCDSGSLRGWMDAPLAIDVQRVVRLERAGFDVTTQQIPAAITPKNRLLLASPRN